MSIQKKILSMTIGPVVLLGLLSIFFMLTTVRSSMMEEIEEKTKIRFPEETKELVRRFGA